MDDALRSKVPLALEIMGADRGSKLLREWLEDVLPAFCFFSFQSFSEDGEAELCVYQLITVPQKTIFISSYDDRTPPTKQLEADSDGHLASQRIARTSSPLGCL
jgi:hypothetical protein